MQQFPNKIQNAQAMINEISSLDPANYSDVEIDAFFEDIFNKFKSLAIPDNSINNLINNFINKITPHKDKLIGILKNRNDLGNTVINILPNFLYFSDVDILEDKVSVSDFLSNKEAHKTLSNLTELLNIDIEKIKDAETYDKLSTFGLASVDITIQINQSWTQEKIKVQLGIDKDELVISIIDDVIKKHHRPSIRSKGFQWFFSFYINFSAGSKGEFKNTIIMLDDMGIFLHPSGQRDLLNTIEEIAESNQFIFSTHSPFMVNREKLERIRIVSKTDPDGTIIEDKYYKSDFDALEPIRASIGMTIGDSLFTTKKNLLVEGFSDELIIEAMSTACSKKEMEYIDTIKISILPVNGADKMPFFATICKKENLKFLALLDFDSEGRRVAKELKEKFNINDDNIMMLNVITQQNHDLLTENLIDLDFYIKAVNAAYGDIFQAKIGNKSIGKEDLEEASFSGINKFFRKNKIGTSKRIDKIKVAKKINELVSEDIMPSANTISNFFQLFKTINEKLKNNPK